MTGTETHSSPGLDASNIRAGAGASPHNKETYVINGTGPLASACSALWDFLRGLPAPQRIRILDAWCRSIAS